jgi:hypothetical protein
MYINALNYRHIKSELNATFPLMIKEELFGEKTAAEIYGEIKKGNF